MQLISNWLDIAKTVTLQHCLFSSIRLEWSQTNSEYLDLRLSMTVNDRNLSYENDVEVWTDSSVLIEPKLQNTEEILQTCARGAREALRYLVCHEVDEMLLVNGKRQWDPHATEMPS